MRHWAWLLVALAGCGSLEGPKRPNPSAGPGLLTPCPAGASHRSYRRPEVVVVQCETPDGVIDGWKASFWPGGRRALFAEYRRGLPHGWVSTWDEQGRKRAEGHWVDGLRSGRATEWYPSGHVSSTVRYRDGVRDGRQLLYYENGQLMSQAEFKGGVQHGPVVARYRDGVKQVEGAYRNGRADGVWSYWDTSGALDTTILWHAGRQAPRGALLISRGSRSPGQALR